MCAGDMTHEGQPGITNTQGGGGTRGSSLVQSLVQSTPVTTATYL